MPVPDRTTFESAYAGQAPWDIGRPQEAIVDVANEITGSILDAGCGTGDNALFLAGRGHKVTGIDFLSQPITRAKQKAVEQGVRATFLVMDALALKNLPEVFDSVIDSGLFHVFSDDDRRRYVEGLASVLKPGGRLFLLCFSDEEPGTQGPRRVSRKEIEDAFAEGWKVESIEATRFEVRPDLKDISFSEGGPKAWFVVVQRKGVAPSIERIVETALYAEDLESMEAFYANVLGLPVIAKETGRHVFFRVGTGSVLLIFQAEVTLQGGVLPAHGSKGPGHLAFGIQAGLSGEWRQYLVNHGVPIEIEIVWPKGGKSIYFRDPAGNSVELITPGVWGTPGGW